MFYVCVWTDFVNLTSVRFYMWEEVWNCIHVLMTEFDHHEMTLQLAGCSNPNTYLQCDLWSNLPWYNHNGWLGVKHQVTYLHVLWSKSVLCISSFRILVFAKMHIAGRTFSNFGLLPRFRMMLAPRANSPSFTKAPKGTLVWAGRAVC